MLAQYISRVLAFAGRGLVLRTDALQILIAALLPAFFQIIDLPMPETTATAIAAYVGYGLAIFFLMRIVAAPYFLWRAVMDNAADLQRRLGEPEFLERQRLADANVADKLTLAKSLGQLKYWVQAVVLASRNAEGAAMDSLNLARRAVGLSAEELSYDEALRHKCFEVVNLCDRVVVGTREGADVRIETSELNNAVTGVQRYLRTGDKAGLA